MSQNQSSVMTMATVLRDCLDSISGDTIPIVVFTPHQIFSGNIRDILGDLPKSKVLQCYIQDHSWRFRDSRVTVSDLVLKCMVEEAWVEWVGLENMDSCVKTCVYKSPWVEGVRLWNPQSVTKDAFLAQWVVENVSYVDMLTDEFDFPSCQWVCGNDRWEEDRSVLAISSERAASMIRQKTLEAVGEEFTKMCEEVKRRKNKVLPIEVNSNF